MLPITTTGDRKSGGNLVDPEHDSSRRNPNQTALDRNDAFGRYSTLILKVHM